MCFFWQWDFIVIKKTSSCEVNHNHILLSWNMWAVRPAFTIWPLLKDACTMPNHFNKHRHSTFEQCGLSELTSLQSVLLFSQGEKLPLWVRKDHSISVKVTIASCSLSWCYEHWAYNAGTVPPGGFITEAKAQAEDEPMIYYLLFSL